MTLKLEDPGYHSLFSMPSTQGLWHPTRDHSSTLVLADSLLSLPCGVLANRPGRELSGPLLCVSEPFTLQIEPVKLGLPVSVFNIPNNSEAANW